MQRNIKKNNRGTLKFLDTGIYHAEPWCVRELGTIYKDQQGTHLKQEVKDSCFINYKKTKVKGLGEQI